MDNNSFDNIIKAKLEGLTTGTVPQWDKLMAKKNLLDSDSATNDSTANEFDQTIKSKLENLTTDTIPQWDLLLAKKNALELESTQEFDTQVKSKLESLTTDTVPQWDLLLAKKQALELESTSNFDSQIKGKLEQLSTNSVPQWDKFKVKKDALDDKRRDREFDDNVRSSVDTYSVSYNSSHWVLLKERLEGIYKRRKQLYITKSLEFMILMLFFIGVSNNYSELFDSANKFLPSANVPMAENENRDEVNDKSTKNATSLIDKGEETNSQLNEGNANDLVNESSGQNLNSQIVQQSNTRLNQNASLINDSNGSSLVDRALSQGTTLSEANTQVTRSAESNTKDLANQGSDVKNSDITTNDIFSDKKEVGNTLTLLEGVQSLNNSNIGLLEGSERDDILLPESYVANKQVQKVFENVNWLHIVATFDNNLIHSPYHETFYPTGPAVNEMFGYSLSGLISFERNAFEYETGLTYSVFNKPLRISEDWESETESFTYKLNNINYDIISIPLRLKYHFVKTQDWSLFMTGGLSPEVIVSAGYEEYEEWNGLKPIDLWGTDGQTASNYKMNSDFNTGIFDGGSFKENFMLRTTVGIGIQRNITPSLTAYFTGDYYHSVLRQDYGPSDDKINKFALSFGMKERF